MKRPAVFFDRDNTLIACDEYLGDPNKVCLVDGAADAVARARQLGYATVIFSNQSGVARGYFSEQAVHAVNQRLDEMLVEQNAKAVIDRHEFCPFHPDASIEKYRQNSPLRKPSPGMIHSAADALALDLERSWVIGDAPRDIEAGHAAGCRTILFSDPSLKSSPAALANTKVEPDYVCSTLKEAMDYIEKNTERPAVEEPPPSPPSPPPPTPAGPATQPEPPAPTPSIAKVLAQSQPHSTARLESLVNELVQEIRRQREVPHNDFSVSKLMAGVTQILVLAILFMAFLGRGDLKSLVPLEIFALTLQTMTISLLIMGRQK
jgi:D-glycero-D-manno-heptose 1,7-bisphosphate phosphatase